MTPRRAIEIRLPSDAAADPVAELFGVGCLRAGACTAGGDYAAAGASENGFFYRVACPRTGPCAAVGYYRDTLGNIQAVAYTTGS